VSILSTREFGGAAVVADCSESVTVHSSVAVAQVADSTLYLR
jgi:hypothetical protein